MLMYALEVISAQSSRFYQRSAINLPQIYSKKHLLSRNIFILGL